jgi:hypothetical protein
MMLDLDAELPRLPRPLPKKIPAGAHVLSRSDLRAISKHFAGRDDPVLGEELIPHLIHHSMFDAASGRVIPPATLAALDPDGNPHTGKRVLQKFLANIRRQPAHFRSGGAAKMTKADANYRDATGEAMCAGCSMFRPDNHSCSLVNDVRISRTSVCDFYEPRKGTEATP